MAKPRPIRRAVVAAHLALPDRHQRVPRSARPTGAAGAPDGVRPGGYRRGPAHGLAAHPLARASARCAGAACGCRPLRAHDPAAEYPSRIRSSAAAPASEAARGAPPRGGPRLVRRGDRRKPRHLRRLGEQRTAARACHPREPRRSQCRRAALGSAIEARPALRGRVLALRRGRAGRAAPSGRNAVHAALYALAARAGRDPKVASRAGIGLPRLPTDTGPRLRLTLLRSVSGRPIRGRLPTMGPHRSRAVRRPHHWLELVPGYVDAVPDVRVASAPSGVAVSRTTFADFAMDR